MHTIVNQSRNKKDPLRISIKILEISLSKISHWHCSGNEASGISIHSSIFTSIKIQHWTTRTDYPPLTKEKERWLKTWYQNTYERNVQTYVVVSITQICCTNANTHFKTSPLRWITNILLFNPLHVRYVQVVMGRPYSIFRNWNKKKIKRLIAFGNGLKMYELEDRFIISIRFAHDDIDGSLAEHRIYHAHNY